MRNPRLRVSRGPSCATTIVVPRPGVRFALAAMLLVTVVAAAPARADDPRCAGTIAKSAIKFLRSDLQALRKCKQAVVTGTSHGACPDSKAQLRMAVAADRLRSAIADGCSGAPSCGPGGNPSALGWGGNCPDFAGAGCTNAIASCNDIATCVQCMGDAAVNTTTAAIYDSMNLANDQPQAVNCQIVLGANLTRVFDVRLRTTERCEERVLSGDSTDSCPNTPNLAAIAKAVQKATGRLCAACGGSDMTCGTSDDLTPAEIGAPTSCPDVTVPGGPSCAGPIDTLEDLGQCLSCLTQHASACMDRASVRTLKPYPPECQ
jgi:hypothetical protein